VGVPGARWHGGDPRVRLGGPLVRHYLHGDDIRAALGRSTAPSAALRASVSHIAQVLTDQGWGPATLRLAGIEEFPVSGGGGREVTGDPMTFVLVSTGRGDPATMGLDPAVDIYH